MKCLDIQKAIWAGEKSYDIDLHLSSCDECRRELEEKSALIEKLRAIDVPLPSKSLLPSQEVIRASVKRNRRKPWTRFTPVAAAAVVVLGLFAGLQLQQGSDTHSGTSTPKPKADLNPNPLAAKQLTPTGEVTVEVDPASENQDLATTLADFLKAYASPQEVKSIKILNVTYYPSASSVGVMVGEAQMDIERQPNASSAIVSGNSKGVVSFRTNSEGQWKVDMVEQLVPLNTPEAAANLWALGMINRNGVSRYLVADDQLRDQLRPQLEESNWSVGTSSPQAESFELGNFVPIDSKQTQVMVTYHWKSSAGTESQPTAEQLTIVQDGNRFYVKQAEDKGVALHQPNAANHSDMRTLLNKWTSVSAADTALLESWGDPTQTLQDPITGNPIYRYDYPVDGYEFQTLEGSQAAPVYDEQGLAAGKMQAQVFVYLTADKHLKSFKMYYREGGAVYLDELIEAGKISTIKLDIPPQS